MPHDQRSGRPRMSALIDVEVGAADADMGNPDEGLALPDLRQRAILDHDLAWTPIDNAFFIAPISDQKRFT